MACTTEDMRVVLWKNIVIGTACTGTEHKYHAEHEAAYNLLYNIVQSRFENEDTEKLVISRADNGKPFFENSGLHFNVSHCRGMVACAVSYESEVGIDAENVRSSRENVAKRIMTLAEYEQYQKSDKSDEFFFKVWTYKESVLKLTGEGIRAELNNLDSLSDNRFDVNFIKITKSDVDYYVSVARKNISL